MAAKETIYYKIQLGLKFKFLWRPVNRFAREQVLHSLLKVHLHDASAFRKTALPKSSQLLPPGGGLVPPLQ